MTTLEKRVEQLERENRGLKRGAVVALVLAGSGILLAAASGTQTPNEVRTRKLVVVDDADKPRAVISTGQDSTFLTLLDNTGKDRVSVLTSKDTSWVELIDDKGVRRASLVDSSILTELLLRDRADNRRVSLSLDNSDSGTLGTYLSLDDESKHSRVTLRQDKQRASLALDDDAGEGRVLISAKKDGSAILLSGPAAGASASLDLTNDGPSLDLVGADGFRSVLGTVDLIAPKTGTKTKRSTASLVLFNANNTLFWEAPE